MVSEKGVTQQYAFTITISGTQRKYTAEQQYDNLLEHVKERLSRIAHQYTLIAELTVNCDIHYHGVITFPMGMCYNYLKYFRDHFRCRCKTKYVCKCLTGFVDIKVMTDYEGWKGYISEDFSETIKSINRPVIIMDGCDLFPEGQFTPYLVAHIPRC